MTRPALRSLISFQHKLTLQVCSTEKDEKPHTVTLALRRRAPVPALEDMASLMPAQRQYLSLKEIEQKYGTHDEDLARVIAYADKWGLTIEETDPRASMLQLSGARETIWSAFHVQEENGLLSAAVPVELGESVRWLFGLDGRKITRPTTAFSTSTAPEELSAATSSEATSLAPVTSYSAPQVAKLYEYPALDGADQCLGIIALQGAWSDSDMEAYFGALRIKKPNIIDVGPNVPADFWIPNAEVTQDIQVAAAVCPGATIVVYHERSPSIQNYFQALRTAIFDPVNRPSVLSVSWSFPEVEGLGPTPEEAELFDELFRLAALQGITICSSCGDYGSVAPVVQFGTATLATAANFAATSPYVLGCGGTSLYSQHGSISQEVVWNRFQELAQWRDPKLGGGKPFSFSMATGGGISTMFPLPVYQRGAQVPPAIIRNWNEFVLVSSRTFAGRGTPDVAANADLLTGYETFFDGRPSRGGGTSASAPMWAALVILLNEGLARNHGPHARVGWLNPLLYSLALSGHGKVVRRITEGGNGGYSASATAPWNACTGLGSPRGTALAKALGAWPVAEQKTRKTGTQDS